MNCPVDNQPLVVLELDQVEIDYCTNCEGIWLDAGELELLIESENERKKLLDLFGDGVNVKERTYKCPICAKNIMKVEVGTSQKILIDKCPKNHGLWFDNGELEKVLILGSAGKENKVIDLLREMFKNKFKSNNQENNK